MRRMFFPEGGKAFAITFGGESPRLESVATLSTLMTGTREALESVATLSTVSRHSREFPRVPKVPWGSCFMCHCDIAALRTSLRHCGLLSDICISAYPRGSHGFPWLPMMRIHENIIPWGPGAQKFIPRGPK